MGRHVLAHLNVVRPTVPLDSRGEKEQYFFQQLQHIYPTARSFDGLKWHTHGARRPDGSYMALHELLVFKAASASENPHVMTMAVWEEMRALHRFAYRLADHVEGMQRLRDWVDRSEGATVVMWWVERGKRVQLEEGWERLQHLRAHGASPHAFTLQQRFDAPGEGDSPLRVTG